MKESLKLMSDEELIAIVQQGNHRYFSELVRRYESYILKKCMGYVRHQNDAEELTQEVLIKVFMQIGKFRKEAKFKTWLFAIVYHACVDHIRKSKKKLHQVITEKLADELTEMVDYDDQLPADKSIEILEALLEELTAEDKQLLIMKYREKHHIREIQVVMGLSESAIKMRLHRAKERLNVLYAKKLKR